MKKLGWCFLQRKKFVMPNPVFENNWEQDRFKENVKAGIKSLQEGKAVHIFDDGRGYELAREIKHGFILEYQKRLSEQIEVTGQGTIVVKFKNKL
jgi:hypothetical protein